MPGEMSVGRFKITMEQFHALRDERPKEEKWELIEGVPVMMPPPSLMHQSISQNLEYLLNRKLEDLGLPLRAHREIGVLLSNDDSYNPEPDVTVIDKEFAPDQLYAGKFYFVAEIVSPNDKERVLSAKLAFYQGHAHCLGVIFVRQDQIGATIYTRDCNWVAESLTAQNRIEVPNIGDIGILADLYRNTPHFPQ